MPIVPPISWPVELRPEIIPVSSSRAPVRIGDRDGDDGDAEPESGDEHAGQDVADVAAVLADVGEQGHAGRGDEEGAGEWAADAVLADDVAGRVRADPGRERERDEGEAGRERPHAEHVLEVERAEQEEAEDRAGCGEHQEEAAADGAVGQPLDPQERRVGAALESREGREAGEAAEAEEVRLDRRPTGALGLGDREDDRAETRRCEHSAAEVETLPARLLRCRPG